MDTKVLSVYNLGRGVLLNSKVTVADNAHQPLRLLDQLISGLGLNAEAGLWLTPLNASPLVPRVFPFDFLYLDKEHRVLETIEIAPGIDFPPYSAEVASALILPPNTLHATNTKLGDRLAISTADEMPGIIASAAATASPKPAEKRSGKTARKSPPPAPPGPEQIVAVLSTSPAAPQSSIEPALPAPVGRHSEPVANGSKSPSDAALPPRSVRPVPSPVVEHHIDPEDLFSNWIVSPSVAPAWVSENDSEPIPPRVTPERPQPPAKLAPSQPPLATSPNGVSPEASAHAGHSPSPTPKRVETPPPDPGAPENPPSSAQEPISPTPRVSLPQLPVANTFTASGYGMWRVSMPTALAPAVPASPAAPPPSARAAAASSNAPTQTDSTTSAPSKSETAQIPESNRTSAPHSAESPVAEPHKLRTWPSDNIVKPIGRPALAQFTASIQDKIDKLEPESPPRPAPAQRSPVPRDIKPPQPAVAQPPAPPPSPVPAPRPPAVARNSPPAPSPRPAVSASTKPAAKSPSKLDSQSKPTLPAAEPQPKNGAQHPSLTSRFKQWLNPTTQPSDRRGATRRYVPGMVAHYFTGGAPKPHSIADISMSGIYILTEDRWMPGTMIQMTLQKPCARGERKQSITVLSKIVRRGSDGVAAEFVMPDGLTHWNHDIQPAQATDKFALARFL